MIELSLYISSEGIFQARLWWWQGEFRSKWVLGQTLELWEKCQKPSTLRRFWGFSGDDQERSVHHEICRQSTVSKKIEKLSHFSCLTVGTVINKLWIFAAKMTPECEFRSEIFWGIFKHIEQIPSPLTMFFANEYFSFSQTKNEHTFSQFLRSVRC